MTETARPLTILGDLVHNPTVLNALEEKGIAVARDVAQAQAIGARRIVLADPAAAA